MQASVFLWEGAESRAFAIERGVRQGDPLSTLLFNLVLDEVLQEVGQIWQRRGYGSNVGQTFSGERLTHVAFADDMTLLARSWTMIRRMVSHVRAALAKRGLSLHPDKCKLQTNRPGWQRRGAQNVDEGFDVTVLPEGAPIKVLGTMVDLFDVTGTEVRNRISAGWRMFWSMSRQLQNKKVSLKKRLQLFDATVSSCVLWCAQSWTPRVEELNRLTSTRHAMLRRMVGTGRGPDEEWLPWFRRATHAAVRAASLHKVRDWVSAHGRCKWLWAGHVARRPASTWVWRVTTWRDYSWQQVVNDSSCRPLRPSRRRWMKWEDSLRRFAQHMGIGSWNVVCGDRERWTELTANFVQWSAERE